MRAGRYAPSPTGQLHLGNLRTALLAWLFARHTERTFLLRIEDLDRVRAGAEAQQLRELEAIGLNWDAEPVRQSERIDLYEHALDVLRERGLVYECFCSRKDIAEATSAPHPTQSPASSAQLPDDGPSPHSAGRLLLPPGSYPGTCRHLSESERERRRRDRPAALRIDAARAAGTDGAPAHQVTDGLHGTVRAAVDDFVLRRNDGAFAYNLAVVVDDLTQGVDQVVRGDDLLSSAPRQDWLAGVLWEAGAIEVPGEAQDRPVTEYAHVPLVLNTEGTRLAKRDGAVTLEDLGVLDGPGGQDIPDTEPAPWTADRVRTVLLESVGLPGESLDAALDAFAPDRLPRTPWIFTGLD